jgi:HSP20 family protein
MPDAAAKLPSTSEKSKSPAKKVTPPVPHPWQPFESLRQEIDRLFEDFGTSWPRLSFGRRELEPFRDFPTVGFSVATDVVETDRDYRLTAELPGMDEKDIEVTLSSGVLGIKGEKREEFEESKKDYYRSERSFGSFQRSFRLPDDVDADRIEATLKKGVLSVVMPKTAEAQKKSRKVEIKSQ